MGVEILLSTMYTDCVCMYVKGSCVCIDCMDVWRGG